MHSKKYLTTEELKARDDVFNALGLKEVTIRWE